MSLLAQLQAAMRLHQAGQLPAAEAGYREVLCQQPDQPDALHYLGLLLSQTGRPGEAVPHLRRALELSHGDSAVANNLGEVLRKLGQLDEAVTCFVQALARSPQAPEPHFNLANTFKAQGRTDEAIASYRQAIKLRPGYAKAHFNLANLLREEGRTSEAAREYRHALAVRPDWRDAHLNLGNACFELHDLESAVLHYEKARALNPDDPEINGNLGNAHLARGNVAKAAECYGRVLARQPDNWLGQLRLETLCEAIPFSSASIDEYRARLAETLDRWIERRPAVDPAALHQSGAEPPLALAYHGRNDLPLKRRYADLFAPAIVTPEPPLSDGPPQVGVVVTRGHEGVFANCLGGLVQQLHSDRLQVTLVCGRASANVLRHLLGGDLRFLVIPERVDEAAERIRQARFDLLHYWEVGTDSTNYFLPFFRPAPLQTACWGWPVTTGNPFIHGYLSSRLLEPDDAASHYSEKLILLDTLPTWYRRPPVPAVLRGRDHFGLPEGEHLYLCVQNLRKYHPDFDAVLADILRADPAGRLLLMADEQPAITELLLARLRSFMPDVVERVQVLPRMERPDYLNLIAVADVVLDTPHYGGGANTVYDAFAVGAPVVTLPGKYHRGRWTLAAYRKLEVAGPVATSPAEYVRLAVRVAAEPDWRESLRQRIAAAGEVLFEDGRAVREHERVFLQWIAERRQG